MLILAIDSAVSFVIAVIVTSFLWDRYHRALVKAFVTDKARSTSIAYSQGWNDGVNFVLNAPSDAAVRATLHKNLPENSQEKHGL